MKNFSLLALLLISLLSSCVPENGKAGTFYGPAFSVTRDECITNAHSYAKMTWLAAEKNSKHDNDAQNIRVDTPDASLQEKTKQEGGWWKPNQENTGMPYQWGGFDTPEDFLWKTSLGYAAGDIGSDTKRTLGDAAVSKYATGIDCSGYISRCWRLSRPYSTKQIPSITTAITWNDLKPGDVLLNHQHVLLFVKFASNKNLIYAYEAGPYPVWKVAAHGMRVNVLASQGYKPRRYIYMKEQ